MDYALDLYDITVWVTGESGRAHSDPESAVRGISYDAAKEIVAILGRHSHHVEAVQRGEYERDGKRYTRVLSYVHPDVPVTPRRRSPYREEGIEMNGGGVTVTASLLAAEEGK